MQGVAGGDPDIWWLPWKITKVTFARVHVDMQQDREYENRGWVVWSSLPWAFLGFAPVGRKLGLDARLRMFWLAAHVLHCGAHLKLLEQYCARLHNIICDTVNW